MLHGGYPSESIIRPIARNLYDVPNRKDIKILDFGCGAGAHTWYLAREGFDVYAFDGSETAIEKTKRKLAAEDLTAQLSVQDGLNLDYKKMMFDVVVDSACICCNQIEAIEEMYRKIFELLKSDGFLITTCFSTKTTGYGTGEQLEKGTFYNMTVGNLSHPDTKVHFFTEIELYELLKKTGYKRIVMDTDLRTDRDGKSCIENLNIVAYKKG